MVSANSEVHEQIVEEKLDEDGRVVYKKYTNGFEEWIDYNLYGDPYVYKNSNGIVWPNACVCCMH